MQRVFWFIGKIMEAIGLILMPIALIIGVQTDNLGGEWMIAGIAVIVFFLGVAIRTSLGGDR